MTPPEKPANGPILDWNFLHFVSEEGPNWASDVKYGEEVKALAVGMNEISYRAAQTKEEARPIDREWIFTSRFTVTR